MTRISSSLFLCALTASALLPACSSDGDTTSTSSGSGGGGASATTTSSTGGTGGVSGTGGVGGAMGTGGAGGSMGTGGAGGSMGTGGMSPAPLWDLPMIRDTSTANCTFTNPHTVIKDGVTLDAWNVSYTSWESIGGQLQPITIRAFAAKPAGQNAGLPGIVQAHGLGGFAEEKNATGVAALTKSFVIAYTGPGGGNAPENTSEGLAAGYNNGYRMFDTIPDTRGTWFWGHAVAAMRGLTCLETRPEVDKNKLGMTGFSAGAVATLISAGVDDRIKAAVPLSGSHAWSVATQAPKAWQHTLLTKAGLTTQSPEWQKLMSEIIDPAATVAKTAGKVLMVNGSTDEFFPLTAHVATYKAIPGGDKRTSIVGNFDHGCYALSGVESAATIEARADIRAAGGQRMWFAHWFGTDSKYAHLPSAPTVQLTAAGQATFVATTVDMASTSLDVEEVKIWWSNDDSFIYGNVVLDPQGGGVYSKLVAFPMQANTIYYVDVQYKSKAILNPERFSISSLPVIPNGLVPHIRDNQTCL